MPPLVQIKMQLKNSGINAALLKRCEENTRLLPDRLANAACGGISFKAWQNMPVVSPGRMDSEVGVSTYGITKTGKLSMAKKPRIKVVYEHPVSFASKIILASFYPNSDFNRRTGNVFQRSKPATHGAAEFWNWIDAAQQRMMLARHSSSGFFAACARAVNVGFGIFRGKFGNIQDKTGEDDLIHVGGGSDINQVAKLLQKGLAQITPAQNGSGRAGFSVATTEPDTKGKPGGAIYRIAQPVWQAAVDEEARFQYSKAQAAYTEAIEAAGIHVS